MITQKVVSTPERSLLSLKQDQYQRRGIINPHMCAGSVTYSYIIMYTLSELYHNSLENLVTSNHFQKIGQRTGEKDFHLSAFCR